MYDLPSTKHLCTLPLNVGTVVSLLIDCLLGQNSCSGGSAVVVGVNAALLLGIGVTGSGAVEVPGTGSEISGSAVSAPTATVKQNTG